MPERRAAATRCFRARYTRSRFQDASHKRVAMLVHQMNRGEADSSSRVASGRLGKHMRLGNSAHFPLSSRGLVGVRDDPDVSRREKRREPRHGLPQHGLSSNDIEKLLRSTRAAARPKTRAASSGEQDGTCRERFTLCRFFPGLSHRCTSRDQSASFTPWLLSPAPNSPGSRGTFVRNKDVRARGAIV